MPPTLAPACFSSCLLLAMALLLSRCLVFPFGPLPLPPFSFSNPLTSLLRAQVPSIFRSCNNRATPRIEYRRLPQGVDA
ncbi:hypothetical protein CRG98_038120 [Punica granatum]|uniref:Secreted protein n=1 Tax=Punica granatum TaxID=22663 RepID=A0A2I0ICG0_PUNGR|nr:hypothetical protein CRG98_038120 [Punica granatum]